MKILGLIVGIILLVSLSDPTVLGQAAPNKVIPPGAKVFVAPMPDGFDEFLKAAIVAKKVPVEVVAKKIRQNFRSPDKPNRKRQAPRRKSSCGIGVRTSRQAFRSVISAAAKSRMHIP